MAEFNALHTVLEAAVNLILPCAEINLVMESRYQTESASIVGANYRVECVKPLATCKPLTVTFSMPTSREDGTPLACTEIQSFQVETDGECATLHTIDTGLLKSKPVTECVE